MKVIENKDYDIIVHSQQEKGAINFKITESIKQDSFKKKLILIWMKIKMK